MKTNIKKLSLIALSLGCCSVMHGMDDELAARRTVQPEPVDHSIEPPVAFRAVHSPTMMDEHMSPRATRGVMSSASSFDDLEAQGSEGSFNMTGTAGVDAERPFEERHPRTAKALEAVRKRFQAVSDFFAKRGASPEEMPPATEQAATTALEDVVNEGQEEGLSWESIKAKIKESTLANMVGRARTAVSDFIDEKMHQIAHFGKTNYNDRRRAMKARHKQTIQSMENDRTAQVNAAKVAHQKNLVEMQGEFDDLVKKTKARHKQELADMPKGITRGVVKTTKEVHQAELDRLQADHNGEVASTKRMHEFNLQSLRGAHDFRIARGKINHSREYDDLNASIREEVATGRSQDAALSARAKAHTKDLKSLRRAEKEQMKAKKTTQQSELDTIESNRKEAIDRWKKKTSTRMQATSEGQEKLAKINKEFDSERSKAESRHAKELDALEGRFDSMRARLNNNMQIDQAAIRGDQDEVARRTNLRGLDRGAVRRNAAPVDRDNLPKGKGRNRAFVQDFGAPEPRFRRGAFDRPVAPSEAASAGNYGTV